MASQDSTLKYKPIDSDSENGDVEGFPDLPNADLAPKPRLRWPSSRTIFAIAPWTLAILLAILSLALFIKLQYAPSIHFGSYEQDFMTDFRELIIITSGILLQ